MCKRFNETTVADAVDGVRDLETAATTPSHTSASAAVRKPNHVLYRCCVR